MREKHSSEQDLPGEVWKPFPTDPRYHVSNMGRVTGATDVLLKVKIINDGYQSFKYWNDGKLVDVKVCRAVMQTFVGALPKGKVTRHLNGNPADNRLLNLVYGTQKQNVADSVRHGTKCVGANSPHAKLTDESVRQIHAAYANGVWAKDIAEAFGISATLVSVIAAAKAWRHLQLPRISETRKKK